VSREVVLVVGRDPLSEPGGGHSRYVCAHARAALAAGFEPHLFCVAPAAGRVETDFGVIHRVASPFRPFRQLMVAGHGPRLATAITAFVLGRRAPLILHGFGVWGHASVLARDRLGRRGVSVVPILGSYTTYAVEARSVRRGAAAYAASTRLLYTAQEAWVRLAVERLERRAYRESRLVLVNYEFVRRLIADRFGSGVPCRKVPYASESAFLRDGSPAAPSRPRGDRGADPSDPPLIVAVARQEPKKGGAVLLRALARLRARGIRFRACLAGPGPLLEEHCRLAARLGLAGDVALPGLVSDAFGLVRQADVFVHAAVAEQSGALVILEALQASRAIVTTGVDGIVEDVTDGHDALLVPPNDEVQLADALARALADEPLRRRLGARARETFEARFSARAFTAALGAIYREVGGDHVIAAPPADPGTRIGGHGSPR
jgi:glycosyltransferase involved in cell wall biosynthesis